MMAMDTFKKKWMMGARRERAENWAGVFEVEKDLNEYHIYE